MTKKKQEEENSTGINSSEFNSAIAQICEEKGIDKDKVMETIEAALAAAYKKDYGKKSQNIQAEMDRVSGKIKFLLIKEVVDKTTREFVDLFKLEEEAKQKAEDEKNGKNISKRKEYATDDSEYDEERLPRFNPERDIEIEIASETNKDIKLGDTVESELETHDDYGRVAAQTAKQVIIQRIREAEKEAMYKEYKEKEGQILNGTVQRLEGHNAFIDLGRATGILFPSEQIRGENYQIGQRLKVYLGKIEEDSRNTGIILSRVHPNMVSKLFELEVPEIFSGTVEIKEVAREAGERTKVAVISNEDGLDPIGSCVGQKGTRVQAVIDELNGEKIDIIEWKKDPAKFITAALSPAKVLSVELTTTENEKSANVLVPSDQLSLAIGQRGQNVRLAAKLTGYKIDVIGDEEKTESVDSPADETGGVKDVKNNKSVGDTEEAEKKKEVKSKVIKNKASKAKQKTKKADNK